MRTYSVKMYSDSGVKKVEAERFELVSGNEDRHDIVFYQEDGTPVAFFRGAWEVWV